MNGDFYGTDKDIDSLTYLEFGSIDPINVKKTVYDFKLHQTAYDWFMLARYANDILTIRKMQKLFREGNFAAFIESFKGVHHKNELCLGLGKIAALHSASDQSNKLSFFELGQTLFGCIDCMLLALLLVEDKVVDLDQVSWIGLDISEAFNELAKVFYSKRAVITSSDKQVLPSVYDVFYSKGVTLLYAIRAIDQLYDFIIPSKCAYFDYSFSLDDNQIVTIGTGKAVRYFKFKNFLDGYRAYLPNKEIYVNTETSKVTPGNNRIWLELFIANERGGGGG
ncbi:MAG: hypothetical protein LBJ03_02500 [Holosporales bacterium]|jgi:hypothetical protein|nr:hypothetical protein [Holosporales bacterium]